MKFFLDANVLFAAAVTPKGRVQSLIELSVLGACRLYTADYAIQEAHRNVATKYPQAIPNLERLLRHITRIAEAEEALVAWAQAYVAAKDAPILAAAIQGRVDALVTGDKQHFGELFGKVVGGVEVLSPAQAIQRALES